MPKLTIEQYNLKYGIIPPRNSQEFKPQNKWRESEESILIQMMSIRSLEAIIQKLRRIHLENKSKYVKYEISKNRKLQIK